MVKQLDEASLAPPAHDGLTASLLQESDERFRAIFNHAGIGVVLGDLHGRICETNPALCQLLGYADDELRGHHVDEFVYPADREAGRPELCELLHGTRDRYQVEKRFCRKDGGLRWTRVTVSLVRNTEQAPQFAVGLVEDITERKHAEEELRLLVRTDDLTGLYNRRGFFFLAEQQMKLARRLRQEVLLLFADIDDMKRINDTLGHSTGDMALTAAASVLRGAFRDSDIVARVGGDEFTVLALDAPQDCTLLFLARIEEGLRAQRSASQAFPLSMSYGTAHFDPEQPCSIQELLLKADDAMYEAKRRRHALRVME